MVDLGRTVLGRFCSAAAGGGEWSITNFGPLDGAPKTTRHCFKVTMTPPESNAPTTVPRMVTICPEMVPPRVFASALSANWQITMHRFLAQLRFLIQRLKIDITALREAGVHVAADLDFSSSERLIGGI